MATYLLPFYVTNRPLTDMSNSAITTELSFDTVLHIPRFLGCGQGLLLSGKGADISGCESSWQ